MAGATLTELTLYRYAQLKSIGVCAWWAYRETQSIDRNIRPMGGQNKLLIEINKTLNVLEQDKLKCGNDRSKKKKYNHPEVKLLIQNHLRLYLPSIVEPESRLCRCSSGSDGLATVAGGDPIGGGGGGGGRFG